MLNQDLIIGANQTSLHGDVGSYYEDKYNAIVKKHRRILLRQRNKKISYSKIRNFHKRGFIRKNK